jgi:hypothetical protein
MEAARDTAVPRRELSGHAGEFIPLQHEISHRAGEFMAPRREISDRTGDFMAWAL